MSWTNVSYIVESTRKGLQVILEDVTVDVSIDSLKQTLASAEVAGKKAKHYLWGRLSTSTSTTTSDMEGKGVESLAKLNLDQLVNIFAFLSAEDACGFRRTSKFVEEAFHLAGERYWQCQCEKRFGAGQLLVTQHSKFYTQYLYYHSDMLQGELQHVKSLAPSYEALSIYFAHQSSCGRGHHFDRFGVHGMVCDLFTLESERLAAVLSKARSFALPTIIVDNEDTMFEFKKVTSTLIRSSPASFLPISAASHDFLRNQFWLTPAVGEVPGFLGYAVDLFQMREEDEHMRYTVLALLFKNIMVFESVEAKNNYQAFLVGAEVAQFRGVALDDYTDEDLRHTFPRFRWKERRPTYFRNYRFLGSKSSNNSKTLPRMFYSSSSGGNSSTASSPNSGSSGNSSSSNTSGVNVSYARVQDIVERTISMTSQGLFESSVDLDYMNKLASDLEERSERAKTSYAIVRYSY